MVQQITRIRQLLKEFGQIALGSQKRFKRIAKYIKLASECRGQLVLISLEAKSNMREKEGKERGKEIVYVM